VQRFDDNINPSECDSAVYAITFSFSTLWKKTRPKSPFIPWIEMWTFYSKDSIHQWN